MPFQWVELFLSVKPRKGSPDYKMPHAAPLRLVLVAKWAKTLYSFNTSQLPTLGSAAAAEVKVTSVPQDQTQRD